MSQSIKDYTSQIPCSHSKCAFNIENACVHKRPNCIRTNPSIGPVNIRKPKEAGGSNDRT